MSTTTDVTPIAVVASGRHWAMPLLIGAGLVAAWVAIWPRYVDLTGFPTARVVLPLAITFGFVLAGLSARTPFRAAGAWLALLLAGQAATLRLVDAGRSLHYQHLLPWSDLAVAEPAATAIVGAQFAIAIGALVAKRYEVAAWLGRVLGWRRGALLAAAVVLSGATVSTDLRAYAGELGLAAVLQFIAIATIGLAIASVPRDAARQLSQWLARLFGSDTDVTRPRIDRFAWACALAVCVVASLLALFVYERHPHVQDEVKYLYQARYFAGGLLAMAPPPVPDAFQLFLMDVGPRGWFSVFPPGWPLVLAAGQLMGIAWLVNPALSGLNVLLAYLLVWHLYDRRTARFSLLLLSASPWFVYMGMSFMPHQVTLTCLLIGALAVVHARETGARLSTWIGGATVGFLSLVRQLDAFVVAILLGLWAIGVGGRRLRTSAIAGLVISTALVAALTLPYNWYFTGEATKFPLMDYFDRFFWKNAHAYGFGPDRGMGWAIDPFPGHGPRDGVVNANLNTTAINVELFGWATGSLVCVYFLVFAGRLRRSDWLLLALTGGVFGAYFFNYFSGGPDFGARYWFLMILPGVVLTVRGLDAIAASIDAAPAEDAHARVASGALALSAAALLVFMPWRATDKYHHYLDMRPDLPRLAAASGFGRAVVLVRGPEYPDYASAAIYNPLDLHAEAPVYVRDRGPEVRARLRSVYGDRPVWVVEGPSLTGAGYRVVGGPFAWAQLEPRR